MHSAFLYRAFKGTIRLFCSVPNGKFLRNLGQVIPKFFLRIIRSTYKLTEVKKNPSENFLFYDQSVAILFF